MKYKEILLTAALMTTVAVSVFLQNSVKGPDLQMVKRWNRASHFDSTLQYLHPIVENSINEKRLEFDLIRAMSLLLDAKRQTGDSSVLETIVQWKRAFADHRLQPLLSNLLDFERMLHVLRTQGYYPALSINRELEIKSEFVPLVPDLYSDAHCLKAFLTMVEGNYENALELNRTADSIFRAHYDTTAIEYISVLNNFSSIYGNIGKYSLALEIAKRTNAIIRKYYDTSTRNYVTSLNNLSTAYWECGEYDQAIKLLKESIELNEHHGRIEMLIQNYYNIVGPLLAKGDYDQAYEYMSLALALFRNKAMDDPYTEFNLVKAHFNYYMDLSQEAEATAMLGELHELIDQWFSDDEYMKTQLIVAEADYYRQIGKHETALKMYYKCLPYYIAYYGKKSAPTGNIYFFIGDVKASMGDFIGAITSLKDAKNAYEEYLGQQHPRVYESLYSLAKYYAKSGDYHDAHRHLDMIFWSKNEDIQKNTKVPVLSNLPTFLNLEDALGLKAELLSKSSETNDLHLSIQYFLTLDSAFNRVVVSFGGYNSRDDLRESASKWYRKALTVAYRLYEIEGTADWIDQSYVFSEKVRGLRMQEIIRSKSALKLGGIPDSLQTEEKRLKSYLQSLKSQLNETAISDSVSYFAITEEFYKAQKLYSDFIRNLEQAHGKYFDIKYNTKVAGVKDIQNHFLDSNERLVQYCISDSALFVHIIGSKGMEFKKIDLDVDLENIVYAWFEQASTGDVLELDDFSKQLYNILISPIESHLDTDGLIIVPDSYLNFVSFDALLAPGQQGRYLLEKYKIRYVYSPTAMLRSQAYTSENTLKYQWVGFVPDFGLHAEMARSEGLIRLPWAENLGKKVRAHLKGKLLKGKDASIQNFKKYAETSEVLHFGTHAVANDQNPLESFLTLHGEDDSYHKLYASEIFNSDIKASLAVLTACQTAKGKWLAGEGMVSLARAFEYAGCRNLLLTLWSIDDQQTSRIMEDFYLHLANGSSAHEALHTAKINFLNQAEGIYAHPFYWAGLNYSGSTLVLEASSLKFTYVLYVVALLLVIVSALYYCLKLGKVRHSQ